MRKIVFILGAFLAFSPASGVLAVGSGSGSTTPTCTADTWSCSDWTECSVEGQRVRRCTLTFDCPTASTPKPAESEACESATSNPPIGNANLSVPTCSSDAWSCTDWSTACDSEGRQSRTCTLRSDCSNPPAPPEAYRPCERLQCGNLESRRERILCRLNLTPAGIARELQIEYLPELCRDKTGTERAECIKYYRDYQQCWQQNGIQPRLTCARNVLKLGPVMSEEVKTCRGKTGQDQATCKQALKDKAYDLIKFRFYELEQRAESLGDRGASLEAIADFVATVEEKKLAFDQAVTTAERRQIILDVRLAWTKFLNEVRDEIQ